MTKVTTRLLEELPLVSLDLETTGLRPHADRIVQIGAVKVRDEEQRLDLLVNPGIAIPPQSTAIHKITDADVAEALPMLLAFPKLRVFVRDHVLLGFNIGFDLAVLSHEAEREGLVWKAIPALCLKKLAEVALGPEAARATEDLTCLARHYGIAPQNRHDALGDALICARLFRAMIGDLHAKSIYMLSDAMRALGQGPSASRRDVEAGWVDVSASSPAASLRVAGAQVDPYPYQHRVGEFMRSDPVVLPPAKRLHDAARVMSEKKIDCLFVGEDTEEVAGIVSERDLVQAVARGGAQAVDKGLGEIMSAPLVSVHERDFLYVALGRLHRFGVRHLAVRDDLGRVTGWISTRELTRQRLTSAMVIGDEIASAKDGEAIGSAVRNLVGLSQALRDDGVEADEIASVISSCYAAALIRASELSHRFLERAGRPAPCPFAVLLLGSGGRGESLLRADQDHAIIYDESALGIDAVGSQAERVRSWFLEMGGMISDCLDAAGIPYCTGGVMSSEKAWSRSHREWVREVASWTRSSRPEELLNVGIFFDFAFAYGEFSLADRLRKDIRSLSPYPADFLKQLAGQVTGHIGGTTLFGRARTRGKRYDVKLHLLLPLTEALRALALSRGIMVSNSAARAEGLLGMQGIPHEVMRLSEDVKQCLQLVLDQQLSDTQEGLPRSTRVRLDRLDREALHAFNAIRKRVQSLPDLLQACLFST